MGKIRSRTTKRFKPYSQRKQTRAKITRSLSKTTKGGKGRIKRRTSYKKRVG